MTEERINESYARLGDALASASMCHTTVSALETLLGDAADLLRDAWLVVVCGGELLATAGPHSGEVLRVRARHLVSQRGNEAVADAWRLTRSTVPGVGDAHLVVAWPVQMAATARHDTIIRVLTGAIGLAIRRQTPDADEATRAVAFSDMSALRRNQLLELLLQIQRRISHRAPLQDVLDDVVRGASTLLGDESASIHLIDGNDPGCLKLVAWTGIDDAEWLSAIRRIPMGEGASGRAAKEERLVVFETYRHAAGRLKKAVNTGVAAVMAAPVHTDGHTVGSMVVATRNQRRRYSDEDRTMLLAFADNVSLALTDAHNLRRVDEALHDPVTGLPTRTLFLDHLHKLLHGPSRQLAILFCDLDRFKRVNDSLGHSAGDELLFQVAQRLSSLLRPADVAARLGGDEFAVLLDDVDGPRAEAITTRIVDAFAAPFTVRGHDVRIGISIGLTTAAPGEQIDGEQLLGAADIAMYRAKRSGGSRLRRFEPTMAAAAAAQLALEEDLQHAQRNGELHLAYQPVFDLEADRVAGLEALLRWTNPARGPVSPAEFIPLAEESGLIIEIGAWVIATACAAMQSWQRATGRDDVDLGVNLSARQFSDPNLIRTIERSLTTSGIDPARFVIEITESTVLADVETTAERLEQMRALGVKVALDDFGTGYSSLSHLRQLPIDVLKIDRDFLPDTDDDRDWALTTTMVQMAADLGILAVAEGIETQLQLERVLAIGCPDAQGFLLGRPVPADQLVDVVRRRLPRRPVATPAPAVT